MVNTKFSLTWDSHKNSICSGFSYLQQNGEFVDMTLAADGHHVKVHQVLMALASPYLKDLIVSAPCQHPVIFLNNVSHKTLCLLLEYIYMGEVVIPSDYLSSFMDTAKSLHIKGLENSVCANIQEKGLPDNSGFRHISIPSTEEVSGDYSVPYTAKKVIIKEARTITTDANIVTTKSEANPPINTDIEYHDMPQLMDDTAGDSDDCFNTVTEAEQATSEKASSHLQFTVSIRGSLQVILNRYIYNVHSTKHRGGLRRWRCVDYRNRKCKAFLITKGNVVVNRSNLHNHPFHDKKILSKIQAKAVFSAIDEIENYKEQENVNNSDIETSTESDNFFTINYDKAVENKT